MLLPLIYLPCFIHVPHGHTTAVGTGILTTVCPDTHTALRKSTPSNEHILESNKCHPQIYVITLYGRGLTARLCTRMYTHVGINVGEACTIIGRHKAEL